MNGGVIDTEEGQADDGVLIAQNGFFIFYVTMVNDVMAYFLTGTKNGGITPTPTQFLTTQAELDKIKAFAAAQSPPNNKTFPDPNALAIEVKSAWIETTGITNPDQYITTKAVIPTFDKTNPNKWVLNGQTTTTLALVGMHVVGSAKGIPRLSGPPSSIRGTRPMQLSNTTPRAARIRKPSPRPVPSREHGCSARRVPPGRSMS